MNKAINIVLWALIISVFSLQAQQENENLVKYTADFNFREGVFINFEQVRQNNPIPKSSIVTSIAYDDPDFFDRILENKKIFYFNDLGIKEEIAVKNIWGYSRNGVLYISLNDGYHRITIVGSICHFVANLTTYSPGYTSPYYYPYYGYNNFYNPYGLTPGSYASTEMRQYIMDFKTGRILEYSVESVEVLLMADPELHDEFTGLRKKKKKQLKFLYIRKFNERNPLYFPIN
ncbi:MAG: hypothetical protein JXR41_13975 [Bacteroidales bacterium]|nr:hypothetical protein [Bacteroidales bacterium]MBN2764196.1 hypothetical protein [Bacteroidales bacterium]